MLVYVVDKENNSKDKLFSLQSVVNRASLFVFPRTFFNLHSSFKAGIFSPTVTKATTFHGLPDDVLLAPPLSSPLCCRKRRDMSTVTPTYVLFVSSENNK